MPTTNKHNAKYVHKVFETNYLLVIAFPVSHQVKQGLFEQGFIENSSWHPCNDETLGALKMIIDIEDSRLANHI